MGGIWFSGPVVSESGKRPDDIDDENGEHCRYAALLESTSTLDDITIDRYVELAKLDQDQAMAEAALGKLASFQGLTEEQLGRMKTHPAFATVVLQSIVNRTQLYVNSIHPT